MFGTFFIAYFLRIFRNSKYLGRNVSDIKAKPAKLKNELQIITKFCKKKLLIVVVNIFKKVSNSMYDNVL